MINSISDHAMTKSNEENPSQEESDDNQGPLPQIYTAAEPPLHTRNSNKVYKSGPLFLSSKGIGWTSWKKRWFILTSTSLVFFRSDPNAILPKGSEVNCTLGGIDLNSSGSVVVKEDKKLITVQFPDGRDGRTFTLKAETSEDLNEWKSVLEEALAHAPKATVSVTQNGNAKNDQGVDGSDQYCEVNLAKDRKSAKPMVIGGPVLLALENIDGTPSFLEKALRFVEQHGVKVEGILRQAADVEDVERRIREYEQGKTEFSPEEDAHVIADCVKYVLRELSSSPIPASCCKALVEAGRTERSKRLAAIRNAIYETFPEPNCRLLQRTLMMMQAIAANKVQNRMSVSAVAACMAPLLLRPLLAGECELEHNDVDGDGSIQLLQAAAAANNAQAICITLLEEYDNLFGEGPVASDIYSETEESGTESEELSDEGETSEDYTDDDATDGTDGDIEEDYKHTSSGSRRKAVETEECDKSSGSSQSGSLSEEYLETSDSDKKLVPTETSKNIHEGGQAKSFSAESPLSYMSPQALNKLADQAKGSEHLIESLERQKNALLDCRLALEKDVSVLQDQLQKESELTTALEAGLRGSQGPRNMSAHIDEKTMEMLGEIARVELDINNLKQSADDLRVQLDQKREQNFRLQHMKQTQKIFELSFAPNEKLQLSKHHSLMDRAEYSKDKKRGLSSSSCRHSIEQLPPDTSYNSKSAGLSSSTSLSDSGISTLASTNSRKSFSRGEGINLTTSVFSKFTDRLPFLNNRKSTSNESQNSEKDRNTGQPVYSLERGSRSESRKSFQRIDKSQESEAHWPSSERDNYHPSFHFRDKGLDEGDQRIFKQRTKTYQ
ncbi:hypothetical protein Leryth_006344 [Lithospermum erythrorhizon]|nr:hypothetical protein Leryth_006344 [Lithospermum erythrorhizon]